MVQFSQFLHIAVPGSRITIQVLIDAELGWVYKDTDKDVRVVAGGQSDEGEVAFVEGAHCGDEADRAVCEEQLASQMAQRGNIAKHLDSSGSHR